MPDLAARRWAYLFLVAASAAAATWQLWSVLRIDGLTGREGLFLALFAILFAWIASSFWLACLGTYAELTGQKLLPLKSGQTPGRSASRTAILMPVYNEDVAGVFAGVRAICESVQATGFDFYILSDSTNPAQWVREELEWQALRDTLGGNIFYRHRAKNTGRKSGNIQDFCENWGQLYDYMVILDADSLMTGDALARLVALMDANPQVALIQVPPLLAGRTSPFARIQQFASSVYGPIYNAGLALLQGPDGNYWGHNAIIRVQPFMQHCGLPRLPGSPPFGGEIMSHDFVEAALLRRAGWEVWMAPELGGSFEAPPPTVADYLKRDRRWCQGNLQHLRIVFAKGLRLPSRMHLAVGIMSYLASPLWLILLIVSGIDMLWLKPHAAALYTGAYAGALLPSLNLAVPHAEELVPLVLATAAALYGPKLMAMVAILFRRGAARAHGGPGNLLRGLVCESLFSTMLAPIVMLQHSWYVLNILLGRATGWPAQQRQDRALPFGFVLRQYLAHTLAGLSAIAVLLLYAKHSFGWFVPLLAGPVLAIPLVQATSSPALGEALRCSRLFLVPEGTPDRAILTRAHALAATYRTDDSDVRRRVLEDEPVRNLHLALLADSIVPLPDQEKLARLRELARCRQTQGFSREDWRALLSDAESIRALA